jgi:hypothetical protein
VKALVLTMAGLLLAGCTTVSGAPGSSPTTADAAPLVSNPKDARGITPCALLTMPQATALALDPTRAKAGSTADLMDCNWPSEKPEVSSVAVTVDTNPGRQGLTDTYLKRNDFKMFEPLVVEGYPAVHAERVIGDDCTIYVGLSDTQRIRVDVNAGSPTDTCGLAKRVIAAVLANLPPQK